MAFRDRLRKSLSNLLFFCSEFQKIQRELEHLNKLYLAYKFVCAQEASTKSDEELLQVSGELGVPNLELCSGSE